MWRALPTLGILLLAACGQGSVGTPPALAPSVSIVFPPAGGLTDQKMVRVDGTARGVAAVSVNGVAATSDDGFRTWQAEVPLELGDNVLRASAAGAPDVALSLERQTRFLAIPRGIELDASTGTVAVADNKFFCGTIDLATEARSRHSPSVGFPSVHDISVDHGREQIYVSTETGLLRLNLANRNLFSVTGPGHWIPRGVHWDESRQRILVADAERGALYSIDRSTGAAERRATLNGLIEDAFAFDPVENCVYAMGETIHRLDLDTDELLAVSGPGVGSGPVIDAAQVHGMALDPVAGALYCITRDEAGAYEIDIATGDRRAIHGTGPVLRDPWGIVFDTAGARLLVSDNVYDGLVAIDLATGNRSLVSVPTRGTGPRMRGARDLVRGADGRILLLNAIHGAAELLAFDGIDRAPVGNFPGVESPRRLAGGAGGDLVATGRPALYRLDLAAQTDQIISGALEGSGDPFDAEVDAVELVAADAFVLTIDLVSYRFASLWRVDATTGARTRLAFDSHFRAGMSFDPVRNELVVVSFDKLFVVDPVTGASVEVADVPWPRFSVFPDVAIDAAGRRAFISGSTVLYCFNLETRALTMTPDAAKLVYWPSAAIYDADRACVLVTDRTLNALLAVSPKTGETVIVSR